MNQKASIRNATSNDLLSLQSLGTELMASDQQFDTGSMLDWYHSSDGGRYLLKRIKGSKGLCLIAEIDNKQVGYLTGALSSTQTWRPCKRAEIDNLYVQKKYRGQGIGSMLVNKFIEWATAKDVEKIHLLTQSANTQAIQFYKKQGLQERVLELEMSIK